MTMLFEWLMGWLGGTGSQVGEPACFEGGHELVTGYAGTDGHSPLYAAGATLWAVYAGSDERC